MVRVRAWGVVVVVSFAWGAAGCHRILRGAATQPNPLVRPTETLRTSLPVVIVSGDMALDAPHYVRVKGGYMLVNSSYPLHNVARFTVVSPNRLRFHIQIEHKWREWTDLRGWKALLVDDGVNYHPESVDMVSQKQIVVMWEVERKSVQRNGFGDIVHVNQDAYKRRQPLSSISVFRGRGDVVFYRQGLFTRHTRSLTLRLDRGTLSLEFSWKFHDGPTPEVGRESAPTRAVVTRLDDLARRESADGARAAR